MCKLVTQNTRCWWYYYNKTKQIKSVFLFWDSATVDNSYYSDRYTTMLPHTSFSSSALLGQSYKTCLSSWRHNRMTPISRQLLCSFIFPSPFIHNIVAPIEKIRMIKQSMPWWWMNSFSPRWKNSTRAEAFLYFSSGIWTDHLLIYISLVPKYLHSFPRERFIPIYTLVLTTSSSFPRCHISPQVSSGTLHPHIHPRVRRVSPPQGSRHAHPPDRGSRAQGTGDPVYAHPGGWYRGRVPGLLVHSRWALGTSMQSK